MSDKQLITDEKTVLKAAEAVWGANKYFVLACSQRRYLAIRQHFREGDLPAAYEVLKQTELDFKGVVSSELPELDNALYHILGYFKKKVSQEERQRVNESIPTRPEAALEQLREWTDSYNVAYLKPCRLWHREQPFQKVPVSFPGKAMYDKEAGPLMWEGKIVYQEKQ